MEHKPQKIEIKPRREGESPSSIHLFVDGHEIKGIRKLDFSVEPNGLPHLVLDLQAFNLTVDAVCLIYQEKSGQLIYRLQTKKFPEREILSPGNNGYIFSPTKILFDERTEQLD